MRRLTMTAALLLPTLAIAANYDRWQYENRETIHKSFSVAAGDNVSKLSVDQINGYIHVTGGSGSTIEVNVQRHDRAESQSALADAKKEVTFDMTQEGHNVKLYENGPFRNRDHGYDHNRYEVTFDCEITVPSGASLDLHTVNSSIEVKKSGGDFVVKGVNGKVTMEEIGGTGSVETVNGGVNVAFTRNPRRDSSFRTVNGSIDLHFPSAPDADFDLHTNMGSVYADFDVTTLPTVVKGENLSSGFRYHMGGDMKVRAGKGGPAVSLRTVNGTIRLHSKA